jgi:type I restriction enzyme R subunit
MHVSSFLEFLRDLLELEGIPDYKEVVKRQFARYIAENVFNASQTQFLRAVQSVFLQKRRLEIADLYDAPLTSFGANAVERLFTPAQINSFLAFTDTLVVVRD